ncbi:major facilitator superfamily domain-containing protein [Naematelia encephala]|uniref:Major facilitator superfamily domain-containing protein n=1 Tax=Naematelia encephala TaxID=71784 RepID=A0A1Y2ARV8_9TREE|nr:major facilitator superfamily domain-containing protein [Naematelia encephala]
MVQSRSSSPSSPSPTTTHVEKDVHGGDDIIDRDEFDERSQESRVDSVRGRGRMQDTDPSGPAVPGVEGAAIDRTITHESRRSIRFLKHQHQQSDPNSKFVSDSNVLSDPTTNNNNDKSSDPSQFPPLAQSTTKASVHIPYSAFSPQTKWTIVIIGGIAALFSPISSNIFVPAIPTLSIAFHRTQEDISLAVTIYLVFQAITPSFFGAMSDSFGRRPVYIGTLVIYMGANIGLALCPTGAYWLLLVLRALQATGGSAVIAIGAGSVADVAEPRERGLFMSIFQCGAMIGPAFGPLLGGVFADTLGWRSIFWFLVIATGVVLVPLILIQPETLRSVVGDGSIPPPPYCMSPIMLFRHRRMQKEMKKRGEEGQKIERPPQKPYHPLSAFMILFTPEILLFFIFVSFLYLEFYCVLTIYSTALKNTYHLNDLKIGLCYLPSGFGAVIAGLTNGRQIDYYYRREEKRVGGDYRKKGELFKIDRVRIMCIFPYMACFIVATIALGWCLEAKAPLAATLVVNFFVGLGTGTISTATVYGQDLLPGKGGAVSASLNLVRCIFGAVGTAIVQIIYNAIGAGWTMVLFSGICLAALPLPLLVIRNAGSWRIHRAEKAEGKRLRKVDLEKEKGKGGGIGIASQSQDSEPVTGGGDGAVDTGKVDGPGKSEKPIGHSGKA